MFRFKGALAALATALFTVAAHADVERRAEAVEDVVERGTIAVAGAAPREHRRVAVQAFDPARIGGGAAADGDVEPDERRVGRGLDDDRRRH